MNHKVKTAVFKVLSQLPSDMGVKLYHLLQNFSQNRNVAYKLRSTEGTFNTLLSICKELRIDLNGKSIIEIGSGWLPIIPYLFLYKAKSGTVHTYDLNKHYQKKSITHFNTLFAKKHQAEIVVSNTSYSLPEQVIYYPSQDVSTSSLPKNGIVFSRFVLEHVPPEALLAMHKKFKSELEKGSYIIHFISPSDHRAFSDKSLSLQDFLQYSQQEWDGIQTKFDYHNRLRLPQYLEIFKSLDLEVVYLTSHSPKPDSPTYELFKKVKLHPDYKNYTDQELTAGSINVVLKI